VIEEHWIEKGVLFFLPQGNNEAVRNISLADISAIYNNSNRRRVSSVSLEPEERVLAI
jgi:hypothetical protein